MYRSPAGQGKQPALTKHRPPNGLQSKKREKKTNERKMTMIREGGLKTVIPLGHGKLLDVLGSTSVVFRAQIMLI